MVLLFVKLFYFWYYAFGVLCSRLGIDLSVLFVFFACNGLKITNLVLKFKTVIALRASFLFLVQSIFVPFLWNLTLLSLSLRKERDVLAKAETG